MMALSHLSAQENNGIFSSSMVTNYNQLSGMPQNSVNDFCFDNLGFMWIATWGGLSRFDGQHFKNDFGYKGSFPTKARIEHLVKKSTDTLYAITSENQVFIITHGDVVGFESYDIKKHGIFLINSKSVVPAMPGITDYNSFIEYGKRHNLAIQYACLGFSYGKDSFGIIGKYLQLFNQNGFLKTVPLPEHDFGLAHNNWKLYVLENRIVSINEKNDGLDFYDVQSRVFHQAFPIKNKQPWKLYRSMANHSLFALNGTSLFEIQQKKGNSDSVTFLKVLDDFRDSIGCNYIYNQNNRYLLLTSGSSGLYILHKSSAKTFAAPFNIPYTNYFYAQALMPDKKTVLTGIKFLFDKNGYKGIATGMVPRYTDPSHYSTINRTIFKDKNDYYWYTRHMADSIHLELLRASTPGAADAVQMQVVNKTVTAYFEDHRGNIWFNNNGRLGYLENGTSNYITVIPNEEGSGYVNDNIRCYAEDDDGNIIIGTIHGVYLLDVRKGKDKLQKYLLDKVEIHYLSFNKQTGSLWIGTYGKGLWIKKKNGQFLQLPMDKENNMSIVHHVITDAQNKVWFSTNNGLYVTTKKNLDDFEANISDEVYYYRFSTYDGISANEFNGGCQMPMILQPDGTLTVSSVSGLAWLNTNNTVIDFSGKSLQTIITHGNRILSANVVQLNIAAADNAELDVEVLAPDWNAVYNIQLQYRILKNGDMETPVWQDVNEQHKISFPFLATGDYEIQFRKRTGLNTNDFIYHKLTIHKQPYWYQTIYIYPILLVVFTLLGYLVYKWRVIALRKSNEILRSKIRVATADLKEKNEELSKTIQTRDSLITLFNHDLSTPLFYINRLAQSLAEAEEIQEPYAGDVQLLANSTQDLEELMNEMLLWIQIQQKNSTIQLAREAVNVVELAEMNFDLFRDRIIRHNLITRIQVPNETFILTDRRLFNSILYNLITNAIKYTRNGVVQIDVIESKHQNGGLCLMVRSQSNTSAIDNVVPVKVVNGEFGTKDSADEPIATKGPTRQIGLQLVKSFADMLKITVSFDNTIAGLFIVNIEGIQSVKNQAEYPDELNE